MQIEVFKQKPSLSGPLDNEWYWHFRNKGRVTADSEGFPTKQHAIRAAKAVVNAVVKPYFAGYDPVQFTVTLNKPDEVHLRWS